MHLDLQQAVALAGLAPAASGVEGEPPRAVAPGLGVLGGGKQLPDVVEESRVGGRVTAGRAADGGLVNVDDLVQILLSLDAVVLARAHLHPVQIGPQLFVEDLVDQRGFAAARHAGNAGKGAQGDVHVHATQVIFPGAEDFQVLPVARTAVLRNRNLPAAGQVVSGDGAGGLHDLLRGTRRHDLAAMDARAGTYVYNVVGGAHGVLVVLHHQQSVAQIPQVLEGFQQLVVVPLVKADRGLVEDIEHSH